MKKILYAALWLFIFIFWWSQLLTQAAQSTPYGNFWVDDKCYWEFDDQTSTFTVSAPSGDCTLETDSKNVWEPGRSQIKIFKINSWVKAPADMQYYFYNLKKVETIDVNNLDVTDVTNMESAFYLFGSGVAELDLSNWDTSNVTQMNAMFQDSDIKSLKLGSNFVTSGVTTFNAMFAGSKFEQLTLDFNTDKVEDMRWMFSNAENLNKIDVSSFFLSGNVEIDSMFNNVWAGVEIWTEIIIGTGFLGKDSQGYSNGLDLSKLNFPHNSYRYTNQGNFDRFNPNENRALSSKLWFSATKELTLMPVYKIDFCDGNLCETEYFRIGTEIDTAGKTLTKSGFVQDSWLGTLFYADGTTGNILIPVWGKSQLKYAWYNNTVNALDIIYSHYLDAQWTQPSSQISTGAFWVNSWCLWTHDKTNLTFVVEPVAWQSTCQLGGYGEWYNRRYNIKSFTIKSGVKAPTDMSYFFIDLWLVENIDIKNLDVSNVENMESVFYNFGSWVAELDLSNWDTSNVTDMSYMFYDSNIQNLKLGNGFVTSNVENFKGMFKDAKNLKKLDVSSFDMSKMTDNEGMFFNVGANVDEGTEIKINTWFAGILSSDFDSYDFPFLIYHLGKDSQGNDIIAADDLYIPIKNHPSYKITLTPIYKVEFDYNYLDPNTNSTVIDTKTYRLGSQIDTSIVNATRSWFILEKWTDTENWENPSITIPAWWMSQSGYGQSDFISYHRINLYAQWTQNTTPVQTQHKVTFELDGGTINGSGAYSVDVEDDQTVTRPADPEKTGYRFRRWCEDAALTIDFDFSKKINGPTTVYADFVEQVTTTLVANGGKTDSNWRDSGNTDKGGTIPQVGDFFSHLSLFGISAPDGKEYDGVEISDVKGTYVFKVGDGKSYTTNLDHDVKFLWKDSSTPSSQISTGAFWSGNTCLWTFDAQSGSFVIEPATPGTICELESLYTNNPWYIKKDYIKSLRIDYDVKAPENMARFFEDLRHIETMDVNNLDVSSTTNMFCAFCGLSQLSSWLNELDLSSWNISKVESMHGMFTDTNVKYLKLGNGFDTSNVDDFKYMFTNSAFEELILNFNTSKVNFNMEYMFADATKLKKLDISSFDMNKVLPTSDNPPFPGWFEMFYNVGKDVPEWTTIKLNKTFADKVDDLNFPATWYKVECDNWWENFLYKYELQNLDICSYTGTLTPAYYVAFIYNDWKNWSAGRIFSLWEQIDTAGITPTKSWHKLEKWTDTPDGTNAIVEILPWEKSQSGYGANYTDDNPKTLYAQWEEYKVTSWDNQTYTKWSNKDIIIETNSENGFWKIQLDWVDMPATGYDHNLPLWVSGSLVLTLKSAYLDTLPAGDHTIKMMFSSSNGNYEISATLTIKNQTTWWGGGGSSGWWGKRNTTPVIMTGSEESSEQLTWDVQEPQEEKSEFELAYEFAFKHGITTMDTIEKANMTWNLTRIAMAKMLSYYAINVLGQTPDTTKVCEFDDVSTQEDVAYNNWVTLACQLWFMWVWMKNFRPYDTVIRAEFVTALSRMLFDTPDWDPYYVTHLQKLKSEWIIKNDDPNMEEVRGYTMIMLMRSKE